MRCSVYVRPGAQNEKVEKYSDGYKVWVKEQPEKGRANKRVINVLAKYFEVPKQSIHIISGGTSSKKIIEIT